jgi:hypothetical protein
MPLNQPRNTIDVCHAEDEAGAVRMVMGFLMSQIRNLSTLQYHAFLANREVLNQAQKQYCKVSYMINQSSVRTL